MQLPVRHQDSIIAEDDAVYQMSYGYGITGSWLVEKRLYEALYGDTAVLNNNNLMAEFYARIDSGERGIILQSAIQNRLLMDSTTVLSNTRAGFGGVLSQAQYLNSMLPDSIPGAYNYEIVDNIYLQSLSTGLDTFTAAQVNALDSIAQLCPYLGGDAVYMARALYAEYDNNAVFDDDSLCLPIDSLGLRSLQVTSNPANVVSPTSEYVKLYPNPAHQTINLVYFAQTTGQVEFDLIDQLGQTVLHQQLGSSQTFAQFSVENLSSGMYYWKLKDSQRTIKAGKVVIIR